MAHQDTRSEAELLKEWSSTLLAGNKDPRLLSVILGERAEVSHVYLIDQLIEQGEDIYTLVIPPDRVLIIEISRVDHHQPGSVLDRMPLWRFKRSHILKDTRRRIAAIEGLIAELDVPQPDPNDPDT